MSNQSLYTAAQVRELDRIVIEKFGISGYELMQRAGSFAYNVLNEDGEADRGLFIINPEGVIMHATINKAPVGRNIDETLRVLQAYQYVESHPDEVCPANWKLGEDGMKDTHDGVADYLSSH